MTSIKFARPAVADFGISIVNYVRRIKASGYSFKQALKLSLEMLGFLSFYFAKRLLWFLMQYAILKPARYKATERP
jgi:hypothetical protein